jgi:hypothetical protein
VKLAFIEIHLDDALLALALLAATLSIWLVIRKRARLARSPQTQGVQKDVEQLLAELAQMAGNITEQLDNRIATLNALLKQADQKIADLHRAQLAPIERQSTAPLTITSHEANGHNVNGDPRHADVYTLADQGQNPYQIAQHLGRPSGEIELILALRPHS